MVELRLEARRPLLILLVHCPFPVRDERIVPGERAARHALHRSRRQGRLLPQKSSLASPYYGTVIGRLGPGQDGEQGRLAATVRPD